MKGWEGWWFLIYVRVWVGEQVPGIIFSWKSSFWSPLYGFLWGRKCALISVVVWGVYSILYIKIRLLGQDHQFSFLIFYPYSSLKKLFNYKVLLCNIHFSKKGTFCTHFTVKSKVASLTNLSKVHLWKRTSFKGYSFDPIDLHSFFIVIKMTLSILQIADWENDTIN